ncbi:hypothetical protein [Clostridium sp. M14]|uniref:hypothetical protein n=1 Tax=Clostridium sp. M14 TaxID=2716311 RepID=UPI0013EE4036|nr:hypothetical protein [Clostridium sp. M14]MBZ9692371.1 hypothetical protein [Clostridium sp. M14]
MINIKEIIKQLREDDKKALEIYKDTLDKVSFATSIFINYILDDVEFVEKIKPNIENTRYIYSILRVTVEQVIIYKFLMRENVNNQSLCEDYLGANINLEDIEGQAGDDFELLKLLIGKRTQLYRNIFKQMAEKFEDVNNETSLFRLYSMMADHVHNAYYESILSEVNEECFDSQFVNTIILTLLTQFKSSILIR